MRRLPRGVCRSINKTNLSELLNVINGSILVVGSDTSFIHLAIALKKPTVCVCYGNQVGADSCYGYEDINHWIFSEDFDKIDVSEVDGDIDKTLSYIKKTGSVPQKKFAMSFFNQQPQ